MKFGVFIDKLTLAIFFEVNAITELIFGFVTHSLSKDLGEFCRHRKKQTVNFDDVLLVARKNDKIKKSLKEYQKRLAEVGDKE